MSMLALICSTLIATIQGVNINAVCATPLPTATPTPTATLTTAPTPVNLLTGTPQPGMIIPALATATTATPTPVPTATPAPIPVAVACANSVVNGKPLPLCAGTAFFTGASGAYRRAIPANAVADPNSAAMIRAYFGTKGSAGDIVAGLMWHNGISQASYSYGRPFYVAVPGDPLVSVTCTTYCSAWKAVSEHIPARALAEGGSDGHLSVLQPDGTLADFWSWEGNPPYAAGKKVNAGTIALSRIDGTAASSADLQPAFMRGAMTAGGMVGPSGIVTLAELQAGSIQHELYGTVSCVSSSWYPPATQTARICTDGRAAVPTGALLQYVPSDAAIDASSMSVESKIIAHAMHDYGIRISDTGGTDGIAIQVEDQSPFWAFGNGQDPYVAYAAAHGWNHIVVSNATPPIDRYAHVLTDLDLADNLRVMASGL